MATAATVYSIATHPRTPSIVSKEMYPHNEKPPRPKPVGKRVWASVEKEVETIVKEMFEEALQQDPLREKPWVALVDGNKLQIRLLKVQAKHNQVKLTIIVDIIHVLESSSRRRRMSRTDGDSIAIYGKQPMFSLLQAAEKLKIGLVTSFFVSCKEKAAWKQRE